MIPRFSCALNGVDPTDISDAIHITDLTELPPRSRVLTVPTLRHGLRLLRRVRETLTVRLSFVILEQDPAIRRSLLTSLYAWAEAGGVLTTSDRPGQQLTVVCDTLPMLSALSWSDELAIEFTACSMPFWETEAETRIATTDAATLLLPGTAEECPVEATVTHQGEDVLTTLTLTCGDTAMTFSGLSAAPGSTFSLRLADGLLTATLNDASVLLRRTDDSSDLLLANCGEETPVSVTADQPVYATFHARGRYL